MNQTHHEKNSRFNNRWGTIVRETHTRQLGVNMALGLKVHDLDVHVLALQPPERDEEGLCVAFTVEK